MSARLDVINLLDYAAGVVDIKAEGEVLSVLKTHYVNQIKNNDLGVDAIYFSGDFPSVYFKAVSDFQEETLKELLFIQRKIWNQGKVPFLFAESPTEIRVYNCFETPYQNVEDSGALELCRSSKAVEHLYELKRVFGKISIETGSFWKEDEFAKKVKNETRVDKSLIESLKKTRANLQKKGLSKEIIHDLLLRSLFILYLEDRGATDTQLYEGKSNYLEVLGDLETTYKVFAKLEKHFNGNLSPISNSERANVRDEHMDEIKYCFYSGGTLFDGWRFFDFKVIPIQLISEIYEHFLAAEIGKAEKDASGTFYTPLPLAEFVLNEVLPHASSENLNFNIKICDPTCGSGIFLVESLNRLLDRWQFVNIGKRLDFDTICDIVKNNIFGIELEKEAIKVAAFSLYLAMLDRLEPKNLWQNKRFPYLIYDPEEQDPKKQGHNLFRLSSLQSQAPFDKIEFDILVGNPPFGGKKVKEEVRQYLEAQDFGNETVEAFLHRATQLCPKGKIALISTSKVLFNTGSKHQNFRRFLFNDCYVDKVYNFSILRRVPQSRGRNLFASTVRPISVFFYSAIAPAQPSERLMYCAPTTAIKNRIIDGIAIDPTDVKFLPREECKKTDTKIWKAAMWGTERDFGLLNLIFNHDTLLDEIKKMKWDYGVGFQISEPLKYENYKINNIPHLPPDKLVRYYSRAGNSLEITRTMFRRLGNLNAYKSPHLLIKRGHTKNRLCSAFLDYDASFKSIVFGIHSHGQDSELKILSAFINSNIATYLVFLTSSSWGVERDIVYPEEILDLPDLCFSLPSEAKEIIVAHVDEIISIRKNEVNEFFFNAEQQIEVLEKKIETALWDALQLTENDRVLIEDLLEYQLDAFQSGQRSKAFRHCQKEDTEQYAQHLCKTINEFLSYTPEIGVWATVFDVQMHVPLNVIVLNFNQKAKKGTVQVLQDSEINQVLKDLEQFCYKEHSESIYYRKFFRYYKDDVIYLLKPNEKRFWTRSMGLNDADEIILELLTSKNERTH
jgi:type I restriction-modification system DNA methylase subunit